MGGAGNQGAVFQVDGHGAQKIEFDLVKKLLYLGQIHRCDHHPPKFSTAPL